MANINFVAIRKRIREVLDDGRGLLRTMSAGRFSGDYWSGAAGLQARALSLQKPRFTVPFIPSSRAGGLSEIGSLAIYEIRPTIECEYTLPPVVESDVNRDAVLAQAEQDGDVFRQALGWGANLVQTEAGAPTGIIDGLAYEGNAVRLEDWDAGRLIVVHSYRGYVEVTMAVS